jgi:hypothetical protein
MELAIRQPKQTAIEALKKASYYSSVLKQALFR